MSQKNHYWLDTLLSNPKEDKSWQERTKREGVVNWWEREDLQEEDILSLKTKLAALESDPSINKNTLVSVLEQLTELKKSGDASSANTYEHVVKKIKNCLDELHKNEDNRGTLNIIDEVLKQTLERSLEIQRGI
ncbi:MAG: hypothetical protein ACI9IL_000662 [Rickettsiales bacterium]|jgi:hypothetical protein